MQEPQNRCHELPRFGPVTRPDVSTLKIEINTLLWMRLPGSISLEQADDMACRIEAEISKAWDTHEAPDPPPKGAEE